MAYRPNYDIEPDLEAGRDYYRELGVDMGDLRRILEENMRHINRPHSTRNDLVHVYSFNILNTPDIDMGVIRRHLLYIFRREIKNAFRINLSFSFVMRSVDNTEPRLIYFYAHNNNSTFENGFYVSSRQDLNALIKKLTRMDLHDFVFRARPNSKYLPIVVTTVRYRVHISAYPLGSIDSEAESDIMKWVRKAKGILIHPVKQSLRSDVSKRLLDDKLCIFRNLCCVQFSRVLSNGTLDRRTIPLKTFSCAWAKKQCLIWLKYLNNHVKSIPKNFKGVTMSQLPLFERYFKVKVNIFELVRSRYRNSQSRNKLQLLYRSSVDSTEPKTQPKVKHVMNCLLVGTHLCLITNLNAYTGLFRCRNCAKLFSRPFELSRHEPTCRKKESFKFLGGPFSLPATLEKKLNDFGVPCPPLFNHLFCCWDIESSLPRTSTNDLGDVDFTDRKTVYFNKHVPLSVVVDSCVEGYDKPVFFCERRPEDLIEKFISYLESIQIAYSQHMKSLFTDQYEVINDKINYLQGLMFDSAGARTERAGIPQQRPEFDAIKTRFHRNYVLNRWLRLKGSLDVYTEQLVVLGFNSGGYDVEVCKYLMFKRLGLHEKGFGNGVIKRGGRYSLISTSKFRFLDLMNFLSANVSYDDFLKALKVETRKFYWPYEYIECYDDLLKTELAPYEAYYSRLKGENVLESEYNCYTRHISKGKTELEALSSMNLISKAQCDSIRLYCAQHKVEVREGLRHCGLEHVIVLTGPEKYKMLQALWVEHDMRNMLDMLEVYNVRDVEPMKQAVCNLLTYYRDLKVDIFKDCISLPGVSKRVLFNSVSKDVQFYLFDSSMKDDFWDFKANLAGGFSAVFNRFQEAGKTRIRETGELVKTIKGYDATSLYLSCFTGFLPVGRPVKRLFEDDYLPRCVQDSGISEVSIVWLDYIAHTEGIHIKHKINNGNEVMISTFPVDGFHQESGTVYQFQGCKWHGHWCQRSMLHNSDAIKEWKLRGERSELVTNCLRHSGHPVVVMWECDFNRLVRTDSNLRAFVRSRKTRYSPFNKMSLSMIIDAVKSGKIYGFFQCDIHVPSHLKWYFDQYPPLFGNTEINFRHYGEFMQNYVRENNLKIGPRKMLVSTFSAERIILVSDLLAFYLEKGLVLTKVHCIWEYRLGQRPFVDFANTITDRRRAGDLEPNSEVYANLCKLIGNSCYGVLITDVCKFNYVSYSDELRRAQMHVNNSRFKDLSVVGDEYYELISHREKVNISMPQHIAFAILNLSKLTMLRYVYDMLDRYIPRSMYSLVATDTDSIYTSLAANELASLVRPWLRDEFKRNYDIWFHKCYCPTHEEQFFYCAFNDRMGDWKPCDDCKVIKLHHSRDLARFKLEGVGVIAYALSSKLYYLSNADRTDVKARAKGVSLGRVSNPEKCYKKGLFDGETTDVENWGIIKHEGLMKTRRVMKTAFSFFYAKRVVLPDGISTQALDICLRPTSSKDINE